MHSRLFPILLIIILTSFCYQSDQNVPKFICELTSDKAVYKIGEVPQFIVRIINKSNKQFYLIGALEGSDEKVRMPYCFFDITKPKPDTIRSRKMCGNINPLRLEEFIRVKPNESFNPFDRIDNYSFWGDDKATNPESYRNPGIYKIQLHYSTIPKNIRNFMGNMGYWDRNVDSVKIKSLFNEVPKIDIVSNQIEIKFEK